MIYNLASFTFGQVLFNRFKSGKSAILVATDLAPYIVHTHQISYPHPNGGLDVADIDIVINYDVPANSKDYIHCVKRT